MTASMMVLNSDDRLRALVMKTIVPTISARARWQDDIHNVCGDDEHGTTDGEVREADGTAIQAPKENDADDADVHLSMKQVSAMMVPRSMSKSAREKVQEVSRTGRARARRCAHVARVVFFARDSCPGRMTSVSRVHRAVARNRWIWQNS